ncbi:mitochondrial fission ELM1 family protein [Rickettsia hoogstraalii]|uniref:mitochondrial fission ELM1 family protein n=1 Tax=Rickettsia hoogstraalii TaxID=467174 RepID=UPI0005F76AD3|nr:mitochondrial fission ELM1 family protein [Rickettsia hoogstraalii]KJV81476.1 mitochondrial fission ELM1 family protein [Rickettsia hoogstraalii str. RCCE3]MCX4084457.1 mitochondrial fission ELM1 family protein [Rickettsia hoogstraalii]
MKIWVIADDRTGNTHQAIALAEKLTEEYTIIRLQYNCLAKLPNFLLKYYPIHIKSELLQDIMAKPLPDMIITAGRRTAVLAFYLKKKFKDIKLIQIMQPNLPYNVFDAVILPYHDCRRLSSRVPATGSSKNPKRHCEATKWLRQSQDFFTRLLRQYFVFPRNDNFKNIISINGAINNVTEKFAAANLELQKHYPDLKHFIAVIIGGNNKKFNFNENEANLFSSLLNKIYTNQQIPFFISFSRRTPQAVKSIIKNNMPASTIIYDPNEEAGYNPYIAMLANAKYIISTADSISMCSEAASSGKPLYIFCPSNFNSSKHKIFIKQLVEQKIAKTFDESVTMLEEYSYKPLNEAERVAEIIKSLTKSW